jgi:dihydrofolate synthase / folylpolyglutamate synthase
MRSLADWLERQERSHPSAIDLGLTRVREVARRLGLLQPAHRVITVGGTNGKGSTVAFLDAVLRAAGHRCGRFTSPHLTRYNERICVDGVEASDAELIDAFERIEAARGEVTLTFFEYNTLAALLHFQRSDVQVAVLEVGLGGRLDATNLLDADVGVVCSIGMDHVEWLGHSLEQIGREKAGIFRSGRPAVLGTAAMPRSVFEAIETVGARAVIPGEHYHVRARPDSWEFEFDAMAFTDLPRPAMRGESQLNNAGAALAALCAADGVLRPTRDSAARGLREARLRGRFQIHDEEVQWVLDVGHNVPAAQVLRENLRELPARRTLAVCGILGDKDVAGITQVLAPDIDVWVLAQLSSPRAVNTRDLAALLPPGSHVHAHALDVRDACRLARAAARPGDRILVFGSFLCVGPALEFLAI